MFEVQGIAVTDLAERFGTPLYVYDGKALTGQFTRLRDLLHPRLEMFFSLKANPNISVCALLNSVGARAEVSSLVELITARRAGVDGRDIIFLGPGKSAGELRACIEEGIHAVVVESLGELELLDGMARELCTVVDVVLRVNPSFTIKGSGLTMGGKPRQFGIDEATLLAEPDLAARFTGIRLMGVHIYMGTRILSEQSIVENTVRILETAEVISAKLDFPLEFVDIGGGLGIAYFEGETDLEPETLTALLNPVIEEFAARRPDARLAMELGRYLTAPAGTYVVKVRYTKTSMGENFAVADGGTNHHMAAVGIGSFVKRNFPVRLLSRDSDAAAEPWNVTGPLCTPNDTIGKAVPLPEIRPGDLLGVLRSGAYGPTASPVLFLSHGSPAEVLVIDGRPHLVRDRDLPSDLLDRQHLYR